jgi:hypothetical protein
MGPIELRFDVTDALPAAATEGRSVTIAAWLFVPDDPATLGARPITTALLNGGSYDKRYFHVEVPGRTGYSAAEHLAAKGHIVLLLDHLGIGESTRLPTEAKATRQVVARANDAAVRQFYARLARGELAPHLPALPDVVRIGGGHSMGGMQTIVQQAEFRTYEAVMILGYTAKGVQMTANGQSFPADQFVPAGPLPDYSWADRSQLREGFHWEDVPDDVVAADAALAVEVPSTIGFDSIRTGIVAADAARIETPIYICLGERDVSPDPYAEPGFYRASRDITLHILARSAHCQNFAGTRHEMWDRMDRWARTVAQG